MTRRTFLKTGLTLGLGITAKALGIMPAQAKESGRMIQVTKTDEEWRQILTPEQFRVLRQEGTERPFCNKYDPNEDTGSHHRTRCDFPLLFYESTYDHRIGWP